MDIASFLLALAGFSLTAMGLSAIIASLTLEHALDPKKPVLGDEQMSLGIWGTIGSFFITFLFSLVPLLANYVLEDLQIQGKAQNIWRVCSIILAIIAAGGVFSMVRYYFKLKRHGNSKSVYQEQLGKPTVWAILSTVILLAFSIVNSFAGIGSFYLINLAYLFCLLLAWVGVVLWYAQQKTKTGPGRKE